MSDIKPESLRSFIPNDMMVESLSDEINKMINGEETDPKKMKWYFVESITEFYWDDEVKWFVFARLDDGSNRYVEYVLKNPSFGQGSDYVQDAERNLTPATHGYPAFSQTVWEDEEAMESARDLARRKREGKKIGKKGSKKPYMPESNIENLNFKPNHSQVKNLEHRINTTLLIGQPYYYIKKISSTVVNNEVKWFIRMLKAYDNVKDLVFECNPLFDGAQEAVCGNL